jgi:CRP-like cAMP-binding protein
VNTASLQVHEAEVEFFRAAVTRVAPLSARSFAAVVPKLAVRELTKGGHLLRAGELAREVALVVSGLLREHFVLADGTDRTKAFVSRGAFSGSLADLLSGQPSRAWIVAERPTRVLTVAYDALASVARTDPGWARFAANITQALLLIKAEREYELLGLDAAARYVAFQRRYPGLEAEVAARHVASYVGITPVHLSRLRRARTQEARERACARAARRPG